MCLYTPSSYVLFVGEGVGRTVGCTGLPVIAGIKSLFTCWFIHCGYLKIICRESKISSTGFDVVCMLLTISEGFLEIVVFLDHLYFN